MKPAYRAKNTDQLISKSLTGTNIQKCTIIVSQGQVYKRFVTNIVINILLGQIHKRYAINLVIYMY